MSGTSKTEPAEIKRDFGFPSHHAIVIDTQERKRVLRKLDVALLPLVSALYFLSFLDRTNVGNAKVAGMAKDLHLAPFQYNIAAAVFFIAFCLVEVPAFVIKTENVVLKIFRPSRWLPSIMLCWGLVMTLMSLCTSYEGLVIARVFLGISEGGLFPGIVYYLSFWYPQKEQARCIALFYSAATIAGAFGGMLAFGIEKMEGICGLHGWQWIFCIEGIVTVFVAIAAFFFMHDYPQTAGFLTREEQALLLAMLCEEDYLEDKFDKRFIRHGLLDYKTYLLAIINASVTVPVYSVALFTPTIINELNYPTTHAQLLSIPPFVVSCICTIAVGIFSDRLNMRGPFVAGSALVSLIGYTILYTETRPGVAYVGVILAATGAYPAVPVIMAWTRGNTAGSLKRGVVIAAVVGIGNLGGAFSSFIYVDPPRFRIGHIANISWLCLSIVLSILTMWNFHRLNKHKCALRERQKLSDAHAQEFREMGDRSPFYKYTI